MICTKVCMYVALMQRLIFYMCVISLRSFICCTRAAKSDRGLALMVLAEPTCAPILLTHCVQLRCNKHHPQHSLRTCDRDVQPPEVVQETCTVAGTHKGHNYDIALTTLHRILFSNYAGGSQQAECRGSGQAACGGSVQAVCRGLEAWKPSTVPTLTFWTSDL